MVGGACLRKKPATIVYFSRGMGRGVVSHATDCLELVMFIYPVGIDLMSFSPAGIVRSVLGRQSLWSYWDYGTLKWVRGLLKRKHGVKEGGGVGWIWRRCE